MDLDEDPAFHRREWRFQRIGRVGLVLFAALALFGLFGDGPISRARRLGPAGESIDYQHVLRWRTARPLTVILTDQGPHEIRVSPDYADAVDLRVIRPLPDSTFDRGGERVFRFESAKGPTAIEFELKPRRPGRLTTVLDADGWRSTIRQWVLF
jgi:hypothetical protein